MKSYLQKCEQDSGKARSDGIIPAVAGAKTRKINLSVEVTCHDL